MNGIKLLKINDENKFEDLCLHLYRRILKDDQAQKNGRKGQKQCGVDIFGRKNGNSSHWIGIQCKSRTKNLNESEIINEIKKAKKFNPKLSEYIIVTTLDRDQNLQEITRKLTEKNLKSKSFSIALHFWQDIEDELKEQKNRDILYKFYKDYFITSKEIGNSIGKLLSISIGVDNKHDTYYEILIGKIIHKGEYGSKITGIGYHTDLFFVMNLNDRKFSRFKRPCHYSDFDGTFVTKRDAYIICLWLNSLDSLDKLIDCDQIHYDYTITLEEYKDFLNKINCG